jgi:hypothetical protein
MQHLKTGALIATLAVAMILVAGAAFASQGPGASQGTAGPLAQWMAFACFIGFATLGVVFSQRDDGTYGDF